MRALQRTVQRTEGSTRMKILIVSQILLICLALFLAASSLADSYNFVCSSNTQGPNSIFCLDITD